MSTAIPTPLGDFTARFSEHGLAEISFPTAKKRNLPEPAARLTAPQRAWVKMTAHALKAILTGKPPGELPPLDLSGGTEFQQSVWRQLLQIGPGKTRSYGDIARLIKKPRAVRAVGGACGANPIPVIIPCHRVLAANGKLGGFSGGLDRKRQLLAIEGWRTF